MRSRTACSDPLPPAHPKTKSFTRFFSKNRRGPGGSAPWTPPQRAKFPRRARRELPHRSQRHPQMAQSPRHMPQGRRPHPIAGGGRRPFLYPPTVERGILDALILHYHPGPSGMPAPTPVVTGGRTSGGTHRSRPTNTNKLHPTGIPPSPKFLLTDSSFAYILNI